jgi:hypothetical protein
MLQRAASECLRQLTRSKDSDFDVVLLLSCKIIWTLQRAILAVGSKNTSTDNDVRQGREDHQESHELQDSQLPGRGGD